MFKIRTISNSAPKLNRNSKQNSQEKNRYKCLKQISDTENYWRKLLQNQLQMGSTIVAFQNVQISMRVDAHKKLMLRQTFMLKKQIIRLIINQKYQEILIKLEVLKNKSPADYGLVSLFKDFYNIRKSIMQRNLQFAKQTIKQIKKKLIESIQKIEKQKNSILYGRIVYIAALHLVKLDGVLIRGDDINIVVQALNLKKKQLCIVSSQINQITLQSLLFLTFQFYKILYLLKRDQDLMMQYYNQIRAYISIYKSKCKGFQQFENNFKLLQKIQKMKPLSLNIKIYDDHDRRRILSLQNTQQQLLKNHYALRNANVLSTQINTQITNRKSGTLKKFNSFESSHDKTQNSQIKPNLNEQSVVLFKKIFEMMMVKNQKVMEWDKNRFCFQFIKPDQEYVLKGKFQSILNENATGFTIIIRLFKLQELIAIYKLPFVELQRKKNLGDYAKKLWRIVKQKFYTDKTQFIPNLFSFQYPPQSDLPKHINTTYQLPISVRIHQILLHYLRKQQKKRKVNGSIIYFPSQKSQQSQQQKRQQVIQLQQKIFAKRHGFISFNKKIKNSRAIHSKAKTPQKQTYFNLLQNQIQNQLQITFIIKQQFHYAIIHTDFLNYSLKSLTFHTPNSSPKNSNDRQLAQYRNYATRIMNIYSNITYKCKVTNFIDMFNTLQSGNQYFFVLEGSSNGYDYEFITGRKYHDKSIQEEFQVMRSPVLETQYNCIVNYQRGKIRHGYKKSSTCPAYNRKKSKTNRNTPKTPNSETNINDYLTPININKLDNHPHISISKTIQNQHKKTIKINKKYRVFQQQLQRHNGYIRYYNHKSQFFQIDCMGKANQYESGSGDKQNKQGERDELQICYTKFRLYHVFVVTNISHHKAKSDTIKNFNTANNPKNRCFSPIATPAIFINKISNNARILKLSNPKTDKQTHKHQQRTTHKYIKYSYIRSKIEGTASKMIRKQQKISVSWVRTSVFKAIKDVGANDNGYDSSSSIPSTPSASYNYYILNVYRLPNSPNLAINIFSAKHLVSYMGIYVLPPQPSATQLHLSSTISKTQTKLHWHFNEQQLKLKLIHKTEHDDTHPQMQIHMQQYHSSYCNKDIFCDVQEFVDNWRYPHQSNNNEEQHNCKQQQPGRLEQSDTDSLQQQPNLENYDIVHD